MRIVRTLYNDTRLSVHLLLSHAWEAHLSLIMTLDPSTSAENMQCEYYMQPSGWKLKVEEQRRTQAWEEW